MKVQLSLPKSVVPIRAPYLSLHTYLSLYSRDHHASIVGGLFQVQRKGTPLFLREARESIHIPEFH